MCGKFDGIDDWRDAAKKFLNIYIIHTYKKRLFRFQYIFRTFCFVHDILKYNLIVY